LPLFEDIEHLLLRIFELQQEYRFFYVDTLEVMRAYPTIQVLHQQHIAWQILQMEVAIRFNQSRGAFREEQWAGQYEVLAQQFWMVADHWMYRQYVQQRDSNDYSNFKNMLWNLIRPLFTNMGEREFEQLLRL
jgi:hypothetical protein